MEGELGADGVDLREVDADVALSVDDDVGAVPAAVAGPLVAIQQKFFYLLDIWL